MTRPLRLEFPGAVYHVTSRGNARQAIFLDKDDRESFLRILSSVVARFNWLCHAYCLMETHYHLLVETVEGNLSRGMRQLNGVYTLCDHQAGGKTRYKECKNVVLQDLTPGPHKYLSLTPFHGKKILKPR